MPIQPEGDGGDAALTPGTKKDGAMFIMIATNGPVMIRNRKTQTLVLEMNLRTVILPSLFPLHSDVQVSLDIIILYKNS